jgi:hypothetical protein
MTALRRPLRKPEPDPTDPGILAICDELISLLMSKHDRMTDAADLICRALALTRTDAAVQQNITKIAFDLPLVIDNRVQHGYHMGRFTADELVVIAIMGAIRQAAMPGWDRERLAQRLASALYSRR